MRNRQFSQNCGSARASIANRFFAVAGLRFVVATVGVVILTGLGGCRKAPPETPAADASTPAPSAPTADAATPAPAAPAPAAKPTVMLKVHGSIAIGTQLLPDLAEAYFKSKGATDVKRSTGADSSEVLVDGTFSGDSAPKEIQIVTRDSGMAFKDLKTGDCDIGMSARRVRTKEAQELNEALGDLTSSSCEHVLCLDGIAVIVNKANPLRAITVADLSKVFSGDYANWSRVGGASGPIHIYARDEQSAIADYFKLAVLTPHHDSLSPDAKLLADNAKVAAGVAGDAGGIGIVGPLDIGPCQTLALTNSSLPARQPSPANVRTEQYLLSRRLYLYTAQSTKNPEVARFVDFATGADAHSTIERDGFVSRGSGAEAPASKVASVSDGRAGMTKSTPTPSANDSSMTKTVKNRNGSMTTSRTDSTGVGSPSDQQGELNQRTSAIMAISPQPH
ncbi:MAG TPA: substrate-binding domain-containing protein [Chthoniobacteraceae bacterium]